MEELKKIIAVFIKKDPSEIDTDTLINTTVISGSILIHRMYAAINNAGYAIKEYSGINTYGELLSKLNGSSASENEGTFKQQKTVSIPLNTKTDANAVGIDIESISNFPIVADYREDTFYKMNFSMQEISYCILKENPAASFAGLFSAKEALCKAVNDLREIPFNQIEIKHDSSGKPLFPGFSVSISHNEQYAIAVAIAGQLVPLQKAIMESGTKNAHNDFVERKINFLTHSVYFLISFSTVLTIILLYLLFK